MPLPQPHNSLHGITLEQLLVALVERIGWKAIGRRCPDPLLHPRGLAALVGAAIYLLRSNRGRAIVVAVCGLFDSQYPLI